MMVKKGIDNQSNNFKLSLNSITVRMGSGA